MGGGIEDNIIITEVYQYSIYHNLAAINGTNENSLGELYDFNVVLKNESNTSDLIYIYPNPTTDKVSINLGNHQHNSIITVMNNLGQTVSIEQFEPASIVTLNINYPKGLYFLKIDFENGESKTMKVLKK